MKIFHYIQSNWGWLHYDWRGKVLKYQCRNKYLQVEWNHIFFQESNRKKEKEKEKCSEPWMKVVLGNVCWFFLVDFWLSCNYYWDCSYWRVWQSKNCLKNFLIQLEKSTILVKEGKIKKKKFGHPLFSYSTAPSLFLTLKKQGKEKRTRKNVWHFFISLI